MTSPANQPSKTRRSFKAVAQDAPKTRTKASPLTLRLTSAERARLDELAAGMTLSAYVRACLFAEDRKLQKKRPKDMSAERKAAAEALALLGQSQIASNLNQLAHLAELGILTWGAQERADIAGAQAHLAAIRSLLMRALGKRS